MTTSDWCNSGHVAIDILPKDVLLEIFYFLVVESYEFEVENWWHWHILIHVCQTWRNVIFGSLLPIINIIYATKVELG